MLVESTRRQGYSFNDGRIIPEMCALGVPILGGNGRPLASISLAAIRSRMAPDRRESLVGLLKTEAKQLEESLSKRAMGLAHVEIARRFFHEQGGETSIGPE
jgi:DNA-binding IclR family transcriptional regulator